MDSAAADGAAARACSSRTGRGGGCGAGSHRAAEGSGLPCTRGGRAAPPLRRGRREGPRDRPRVPLALRRPTARTTAAAALVRSACLKHHQITTVTCCFLNYIIQWKI